MMERLFLAWLRSQKTFDTEQAKEAVTWMAGSHNLNTDNTLIIQFIDWMRTDFAKMIDEGKPAASASASMERVLHDLFRTWNLHKISRETASLAKEAIGTETMIIQLPTPVNPELLQTIRKETAKNHPNTFMVFRVERSILGGLRAFYQGICSDRSWLGTIKQIINV